MTETKTQDLQRVIAQTMQNPHMVTPVQMQEAQQWVLQTNQQIGQLQQEYVQASKVVEQLTADCRVLKGQSLVFQSGRPLEITVEDEEWWDDSDDNGWGNKRKQKHKHKQSSKQSWGDDYDEPRGHSKHSQSWGGGGFDEPRGHSKHSQSWGGGGF